MRAPPLPAPTRKWSHDGDGRLGGRRRPDVGLSCGGAELLGSVSEPLAECLPPVFPLLGLCAEPSGFAGYMRCPECSCLDRPGEPAPRRWARARPPPGAVCGQRAGRLASLTGPCSVPVTCARGPSLSHVTGAVPVPVLTRVLAAPSPRATAPRGAYLATGPGGRRVAGGVPLSPVLEGSVGAPCAPSGAAALPGTEQLPDLSCPAGDPAPFQTVRLSSPRVLRRLCGYTGYLVVTRGHPALHPRVVESRGVRPWPCSLARSLWWVPLAMPPCVIPFPPTTMHPSGPGS